MNHPSIISIPDKLRKAIVDARAHYEAQAAAIEKQWSEIAGETRSLEETERELIARIEALRPKLVVSDDASLGVAAAELRLAAVRSALEESRNKTVAAPLDMAPVLHALYGVINHWSETISSMITESLRPYGVVSSPASSLKNSVEALRQLTTLRKHAEGLRTWRGSVPPHCMADIFAVFDLALLGQILLLKDHLADENPA